MKINDAVLLQCACSEHLALLDLTWQHHSDYARAHNIDYWCLRAHLQADRPIVWDKIVLIRTALRFRHYEYLIWMDADALIVRPEEDLRTALPPEKWLGMVHHTSTMPPHANAGMIYLRNTPAAAAFFDRVWEQWPVDHVFEEQEAMRRTLTEPAWNESLAVLPARWNSTLGIHPPSDAVVRAWHGHYGVKERYAEMHSALERMRRGEPAIL